MGIPDKKHFLGCDDDDDGPVSLKASIQEVDECHSVSNIQPLQPVRATGHGPGVGQMRHMRGVSLSIILAFTFAIFMTTGNSSVRES